MVEIFVVILWIGTWFFTGILGSHVGFSKVARSEAKGVGAIWKERGAVGILLGFAGIGTLYAALTLEREGPRDEKENEREI